MKKYITILIIIFSIFSLISCDKQPDEKNNSYRLLFDELYGRNFERAKKILI